MLFFFSNEVEKTKCSCSDKFKLVDKELYTITRHHGGIGGCADIILIFVSSFENKVLLELLKMIKQARNAWNEI